MRVHLVLVAVGLFALSASAQSVLLSETGKVGDCFQYDLTLSVSGKLKIERDGKPYALPLTAEATHAFDERVEAERAVRHYGVAKSKSSVGGELSQRELSAARRLTVAARTDASVVHYSPSGAFTREELELVGEHFDTLSLPRLLPGKDVKVGDTWAVGTDAALAACQFEALTKSDLKGTLTAVKDGVATFTIAGTAQGIELGATARVTVSATGTFDTTAGKLTGLVWEQDDDRDQGAASPAAELHAKIVLKRTPLAAEPNELAAAVLPTGKIAADNLRLLHTDPDGKFTLTYPRDWTIVGRTPDHLVLRLLDKGEFVAQATVSTWAKAGAGQHTPPEEFKATVAKLPKWEPEKVLADEAMSAAAGRWVYRYAARGKQDGAAVLQTFYLVAGANGDQLAVTVLTSGETATAKLAEREVELIDGVAFPGKK